MTIFETLYKVATNSDSLDSFLQGNLSQIEEFCSLDVNNQRLLLDDFERFVLFKTSVLEVLDYAKSYNRAFIYYLMDYCERFCSTSVIVQLYRIIQNNKLNIGSRLEAALLYLYNVPSNQVFVERFEVICNKLQTAINEEDDDGTKAIASFLNYYSYVSYNTPKQFAEGLQQKFYDAINKGLFPFLAKEVIKDCVSLDVLNKESTYNAIQNKIDELLGKKDSVPVNRIIDPDDCIIETGTSYEELLKHVPLNFKAIRNISVQQISQYANKNDIFYSLGRGVKILDEEAQLYSYINSYGNMHEAKMLSALKYLPFDSLVDQKIEVLDWACGQGIASVVFSEYIREKRISIKTERILLLEPSEIALKRASLHIKLFNPQCKIKTVLKDIDSISEDDVKCSDDTIKIHLFSNILDVDSFSIRHLISVINKTKRGTNYFICVSPYITDAKTARIDCFIQHFKQSYSTYQSVCEINNQSGEWINNWSRVIRVFKV